MDAAPMNQTRLLVLGTSHVTSYLGYAIIALDVLAQAFKDNPMPTTSEGWIAFLLPVLVGIAFRLTKDDNKSNAITPRAESVVVPPVVPS